MLQLQFAATTAITPYRRHQERNQKVPGWPWVMGVILELSGFSPGVSQREI
jgi:hypothetical protein